MAYRVKKSDGPGWLVSLSSLFLELFSRTEEANLQPCFLLVWPFIIDLRHCILNFFMEKLFNLFCNWPYMLCKYLITRFRELSLLRVKGEEELPLVAERKLQKSFKFAFPLLTGLSTKLLKNMIAHYLDKLFLLFLLLLLFI